MCRPASLNHEACESSTRDVHARMSNSRSPYGCRQRLWVALSHPDTTNVSPISAAVRYDRESFDTRAVAMRRVTAPSGVTSITPRASAT